VSQPIPTQPNLTQPNPPGHPLTSYTACGLQPSGLVSHSTSSQFLRLGMILNALGTFPTVYLVTQMHTQGGGCGVCRGRAVQYMTKTRLGQEELGVLCQQLVWQVTTA
jgi:hypothetical protein